jgi:hypothetical protein
MTLLLETMYGEEIFDDRNCKVALFAVPSKIYNSFNNEVFMDVAASRSDIPVTRHSKQGPFHPYAEGHAYRDDLGKWTQAVYQVPEGMMVKIFARKTPGFGRRIINASMYICVRERAAYRQLNIALTGHTKARFTNAVIKGRFDILTLEQAVKRGAKVPAHFAHTFERAECDRIFAEQVLEAEIAPLGTVRERTLVRENGKRVTVKVVKNNRMLDLDD